MDTEEKLVDLTLKSSLVLGSDSSLLKYTDLAVGDCVSAHVTKIQNYGTF